MLQDIKQSFAKLRQIKQSEELKAIKKAIATTESTLEGVFKSLPNWDSETQISNFINASYASVGLKHGYESIVASAKNATTIHYTSNNQRLQPGFLLIDTGAEYEGYSADITRTVMLGKATTRQADVYKAVIEIYNQALEYLKPGILMKEYEEFVFEIAIKELKKIKLVPGDTNIGYRQYYPHSTSHFLGLDVHDTGEYTEPIKPGTVVTVEPGIYIPNEGIGIRIEDDVLITDRTTEVLSAGITTKLLEFKYNSK